MELLHKKTSKYINEQQRINLVRESIVSSIKSTLEKNHKVILVYPVPDNVIDPFRTFLGKYFLKKFNFYKNKEIPIFSTSYDDYKKNNKQIIEILDSVQDDNIYRVYPHKHFCDNQVKDKCVANSKDTIYYYDSNHLSLAGAAFVAKDIIDIIKTIKN